MQTKTGSPSGTPALAESRTSARVYQVLRLLAVVMFLFLFLPGLDPARISGLINRNLSLFTAGISHSQLVNGFSKAFRKGWIEESTLTALQIGSLTCVLGILAQAGGMCASLGSHKLKRIGTGVTLGGAVASLAGLGCIYACHNAFVHAEKADKLEPVLPVGFAVLAVLVAASAVLSVILLATGKKAAKEETCEIEPKYQLFLMCLPFLLLAFLFGYLPLYGWRYAFFDYKAGDVLSMSNFVGFKWFTYLVQNKATHSDIIRVMKNTLGISGLGIATSWASMIFAVFLAEIKNEKYRRFVQTFTTIPNFISWVLIFAVATAIFSTDGFVSNLMIKAGVWATGKNLLASDAHVWLQMLAWSLWKGLGWGAIVYIASISGIDQSLYEAAKVDGAGRFARMWNITIPELMPTYCVMLLMSVANILNNGMEQYLVFSNSANQASIQVLDLYVYNLGIGSGLIPLSTAIGMLKSVVSVVLLLVANRISKKARGESII